MDPEIKDLLEKNLSLAEENNKLLRRVRGVQKRQAYWGIFKIAIIIGIALGSFYYLEPYLNKIMTVFSEISGTKQNIDSNSLRDIFKKI